jgi:hypothetical protein
MSYFNHAFKKSFLCKAWKGAVTADRNEFSTCQVAGTPAGQEVAFGASGDFGIFAWKDATDASGFYANQVLCASTAAGPVPDNLITDLTANQGFYFAQKSFRTVDTIGSNPGHGGYTESIKSKMILPKYINKMWEANCVTALSHKVTISSTNIANKGCFKCADTGTNNFLRIDVKGSPALRMLNHNAYMIFDTGSNCVSCDAATGVYLNPIYAFKQFAIGIIDDPIINKLIRVNNVTTDLDGTGSTVVATADIKTDATLTADAAATAWSAATAVSMELETAYVDTEFGTCSFDTRDNNPSSATYGEPLEMDANFVNEDGDQCWCSAADGALTVNLTTQSPKRGNGSPYTVLKDLILTDGYAQNPYNQGNKDSSRFREIEGSDQIYAAMDMTDTYKSYNLLHSVPRFNNPTGVFDNDQYHYAIYTECDGGVNLDQMFADLETVSGVDFETLGTY